MSRAHEMSREHLRDYLASVSPHNEGGEPMVTMHVDLFNRIVAELDDGKRPLTFEEALDARVKAEGFRLEHGPYAIGANNFRGGATWALEWLQENGENLDSTPPARSEEKL